MKKLLIVVDFQNDFIDGALGFPKAKELVSVIKNKTSFPPNLQSCALGGCIIFFSVFWLSCPPGALVQHMQFVLTGTVT